jgi:predicted nuclease of predicted toxin-antitoxin system
MGFAFLADENVERVVVTTLRENGHQVVRADERHGEETVDPDLVADALSRNEILLTHDRDFAALADSRTHAGIMLIASPDPDPGDIARGVRHISNLLSRGEIDDTLIWIEDWA